MSESDLKKNSKERPESFHYLGQGNKYSNETEVIFRNDNGKKFKVNITCLKTCIEIKVEGYGDFSSPDGEGVPIYVDFFHNHPGVFVWSDINKEDPEIIYLKNAQEKYRRED